MKKLTKKDVNEFVRLLWPTGCLEDGDNDPITRYLDGYTNGLKDMANKVKTNLPK